MLSQQGFFIGPISILFRTSQSTRFSGFEATVICFKREDGDQPGKTCPCSMYAIQFQVASLTGCTRPGQNDSEVTTSSPGRRRRDLDEFVSTCQ